MSTEEYENEQQEEEIIDTIYELQRKRKAKRRFLMDDISYQLAEEQEREVNAYFENKVLEEFERRRKCYNI